MEGDRIYKLSLLITSSRRPSQLTNTFMKALSAIFDSPIVRRGSSSLDHIALLAKENGFKGFLVVYTRQGNPSVIDFYSQKNGFFSIDSRIFILGLHINRKFRGTFNAVNLILKGKSDGAKITYDVIKSYFERTKIDEFDVFGRENVVNMYIDDLTIIDPRKYQKMSKDEKFKPAEINIIKGRDELLLRIKIHHAIKFN